MRAGLTMKFPCRSYPGPAEYFAGYRDAIAHAWETLDPAVVAKGAALIERCIKNDGIIYACGNGGSAAIAGHLLCDFHKGIQTNTQFKPRVISLSCHLELLTAIANDISYDEIFAYQLRTMAREKDLLIAISASGDSNNVVRAARWAKENNLAVLAMVGFSGGHLAPLADVAIHVAAENYGVVEDLHQSIMHLLAQFLRQSAMAPEEIARSKF